MANLLVQEWLSKANDDLLYAEVGLKETELYANICFSCQQSFEKFLKTYLISEKKHIPKTHDLGRLINLCIKQDPQFEHFQEAAALLTPYAVVTRYPDFLGIKFSKKDTEEALFWTKELKAFVEERLK